mmetsp:Transcript_17777/g.50379  ORF Transcript_17777/g.50379 Transcript_17777/m.50379 type:complete len:270 (+) Transcript_17777:2787-3596(+)
MNYVHQKRTRRNRKKQVLQKRKHLPKRPLLYQNQSHPWIRRHHQRIVRLIAVPKILWMMPRLKIRKKRKMLSSRQQRQHQKHRHKNRKCQKTFHRKKRTFTRMMTMTTSTSNPQSLVCKTSSRQNEMSPMRVNNAYPSGSPNSKNARAKSNPSKINPNRPCKNWTPTFAPSVHHEWQSHNTAPKDHCNNDKTPSNPSKRYYRTNVPYYDNNVPNSNPTRMGSTKNTKNSKPNKKSTKQQFNIYKMKMNHCIVVYHYWNWKRIKPKKKHF